MSKDECFYCADTGYIKGKEVVPSSKMPDQMCPHCEIGQAVIKGYNEANKVQLGNLAKLQTNNERLREDEKTVGRIWDILGVQCYEDAKGMEISEIVSKLKAEHEQAIKFLTEALPHITCENHFQSSLITAIGTFLQATKGDD